MINPNKKDRRAGVRPKSKVPGLSVDAGRKRSSKSKDSGECSADLPQGPPSDVTSESISPCQVTETSFVQADVASKKKSAGSKQQHRKGADNKTDWQLSTSAKKKPEVLKSFNIGCKIFVMH